tara:strand:- start:1156 stop:2391 length:1236 start_codon:yes stop_codon:yes gene_type:complete
MRYYSLIDNFVESGTVLVSLEDHNMETVLGSIWETFSDPIAVIKPSSNWIVFDSTMSAAKTSFLSYAADGFSDEFQFRFTQKFSDDASSAGQYQKHIIVDGSDQGYILTLSTSGGDNTSFTYSVQEYNGGVLTAIPGLSDTITTPDSFFNVFFKMDSGSLFVRLDSETELTATAPNNHDFSEYKFQGVDPGDTNNCTISRVVLLGSLVDPVFIQEYTDLLIKQYHEKPKALAEMTLQASTWSKTYSFISEIPEEFDVDFAFGAQLDIISKQVFGFVAREITGTGETLTDEGLRTCIKLKIAKNWASSYLTSDDRITIQDVIQQVFNGTAYVVDNYDMALSLYFDSTADPNLLQKAIELDLLPHGQGVRYRSFIEYNIDETFGFQTNSNALTWDEKNGTVTNPGKFARKVSI